MIKQTKPLCVVVGTHHFVQMSEIDFESTGLDKKDLASVMWITPVGASVPQITSQNLKKIFPNMVVIQMILNSKIGLCNQGITKWFIYP